MYRKRASVYVNTEKAGFVKQPESRSDSISLQIDRKTLSHQISKLNSNNYVMFAH